MICVDFFFDTLINLQKEPIIRIKAVKEETKIKSNKNISKRFKNKSFINIKDLFNV